MDRQQHSHDSGKLTWAVLLSRWVEFARGALALPDGGDGRRLRESVADIIMLQAVWFALHEMRQLSRDQRALGLDRAEILIDKHAQAIRHRWHGRNMPEALSDLIADAEKMLQKARHCRREKQPAATAIEARVRQRKRNCCSHR